MLSRSGTKIYRDIYNIATLMHDPDWLKSGLPHSMEHTADIIFTETKKRYYYRRNITALTVRCSTVKVTDLSLGLQKASDSLQSYQSL